MATYREEMAAYSWGMPEWHGAAQVTTGPALPRPCLHASVSLSPLFI